MPNVLVVDDSAVDRVFVRGLLARDDDVTVTAVANGREALRAMEEETPDLVVTDLLMPEIDGLMVVEAIKHRWPAVPVVLMTSRGNEEIASEALKRGAAGYVAKGRMETDLPHTVHNLLNIAASRADFGYVMGRISSAQFSLTMGNDWKRINTLVKFFQDGVAHMGLFDQTDRTRLGVALTEALLNAIFHGNLAVSSQLREQGLNLFFDQVKERSQEQPYCDRRVFVDARWTREACEFTIRDEGDGFDVASLPDPTDPENLVRASGRGVLLMQMFMSEVHFNPKGNEVRLVKRTEAGPVSQ
ncbi:MAG: ATP-binding protein [Thermoguttaceae bacterium]